MKRQTRGPLIGLLIVVLGGCHVHLHLPPVQFGGQASVAATTQPAPDDPAFEAVIEEMLR